MECIKADLLKRTGQGQFTDTLASLKSTYANLFKAIVKFDISKLPGPVERIVPYLPQ